MKKTLLLVCGVLFSMSLSAAETETAKNAVKNMGVGWNLGNTLEAHDASKKWTTTEQHETCWGQPVVKPELLKMMKEAGFGAIRVPVTWYQEMDGNGEVNKAWMARVKEVVDYVIDNGMYCILNVHHDTGAHDAHWVVADQTAYALTKDRYEYLWKQIATEFKDYGDKLLFESYNEMLDIHNSWGFATFATDSKYDQAGATNAYQAVNSYAQSFVSTVRATGGNNANRNLIVNTYGACCGSGTWSEHLKEPLSQLVIPEDDAKGHIIVQVHDYPNIENGISGAKTEFDEMVTTWNTYFLSKDIPMILGEWGTSNVDKGAGKTDYDVRKDTFFEFVDYMVKTCKDKGVATFYWMGLSDGSARSLPAFNQPDLAERIVKAYHGNDFKGIYPTADDFQVEYIVNYNDEWSELFLYGDWSSTATLKLSEYKGIRVEMENDGYVGKLQVKLYGKGDGQEDVLPLTGATTTIEFANSQSKIGTEIPRITLQTLAGAQTARIKSVTLIKADGTEEAATGIKLAWGCTLTTESAPKTGIRAVQKEADDDDAIYNLQGQRVNSLRKGIYIRNGKKFVAR